MFVCFRVLADATPALLCALYAKKQKAKFKKTEKKQEIENNEFPFIVYEML